MEFAQTDLAETCYATKISNTIIQTTTKNLDQDRIDGFMVRFIPSDNYILSHRYSILVKQYIQSDASYAFYKTLRDLSISESVLSENQTGFVQGNIKSEPDGSEKVLGYFELSSMSKTRLFFNYEDFYPNEMLPPYPDPCKEFAPRDNANCLLRFLFKERIVSYIGPNIEPEEWEGSYEVVPITYGDCRMLGSDKVPEFWEE